MRVIGCLFLVAIRQVSGRVFRHRAPLQSVSDQRGSTPPRLDKQIHGRSDDYEALTNQDQRAEFIAHGGKIPTSLLTSGKYRDMGQCSAQLVDEMELECRRNMSEGHRCRRTEFIQSHSRHWLHEHVLAGASVKDESEKLWRINTTYNVDGARVRMLSSHGVYVVEGFLTEHETSELVGTFDDSPLHSYMSIGCPVLRHDCYNPEFLTYPSNDHCELRHASSKSFPDNPRWKGVPGVKRKIELLTRVPRQYSEDLQLSKYEPGDFFSAHFDDDACHDQLPEVPEKCHIAKRRMITVLTHLTDYTESSGGATYFPDLGIRVKARRGDAVVFFPVYLDGTLNPYMRHTGEDAYETKYVAQQFIGVGGAWNEAPIVGREDAAISKPQDDTDVLGSSAWDKARAALHRLSDGRSVAAH